MTEVILKLTPVAVGFATGIILFWVMFSRNLKRIEDRVSDFRELITQVKSRSTAERKKEIIQKTGPKTFYYLNEDQVKDLYPQVLQGLEPIRIETQERKSVIKGIGARLKFFEPKYESGKVIQQTKTYEVQQKLPMMYNEVEQYLIEKGKITFGLEEFEFDKSLIDDFRSMCSQMRDKFNYLIPEDYQSKFVSGKMRDLALEWIKKLRDSSGYVAIQSEFLINEINNACMLIFDHPLNTHLSQDDTPVKIQISCAKKFMNLSALGTLRKDRPVKITCLGKVVSWDDQNSILEISPIAIY